MIDSTREDTRLRILDVAALLLHEHGHAAVTTRRVAQEAGVQAPTIYRFFADKDGMLEAVAEHVLATYTSAKAAVVDAASARNVDALADLRAGWQTQIDFGLANPDLFRLLGDPTRFARSEAAASGKRILAARVRRVAATGQLRVSEQRAVDVIQAAGIGTIQTLLVTPPDERDFGLVDEMYEAVLRQILTDAPALPAGDTVATAVAFRAIAPGLGMLTPSERQLILEWLDRVVEAL